MFSQRSRSFSDFGGLVPHKVTVPSAAGGDSHRNPVTMGDTLGYLPFLGEVHDVARSEAADPHGVYVPPVQRGAVDWVAAKD